MEGDYRDVIELMRCVTPMAIRDHPNQVEYCKKVNSNRG